MSYIDILAASIDAHNYGAVGNGTTDDTASLMAADAAGEFALFPGTYRVASNLTLSSAIWFWGGVLAPDAGVVVTITGDIMATRQHIFSGDGTFKTKTQNDIYPEWYGVLPTNDAAANKTAWDKFLVSADEDDARSVYFGPLTYPLAAPFYVTQRLTLRGNGLTATTLSISGSDAHGAEFAYFDGTGITTDTTIAASPVFSALRDLFISCSGMTFTGGAKRAMCYAVSASSCAIERCRFSGPSDAVNQMDGILLVPSRADATGPHHFACLRTSVRDNRIGNARDAIVIGRTDATWSEDEPASGGAGDFIGGDAYELTISNNYVSRSTQPLALLRRGIVLNYYDYTASVISQARPKPYNVNIFDNSVAPSGSDDLTGTIAINNGSATVTGTGTAFTTELPEPTSYRPVSIRFSDGADSWNLLVSSIDSDTQLTLAATFAGITTSGATATPYSGVNIDNQSTGGGVVVIGNYSDHSCYGLRAGAHTSSMMAIGNHTAGNPIAGVQNDSAAGAGNFLIESDTDAASYNGAWTMDSLIVSGNLRTSSTTNPIGYATGAGGSKTQNSSKSTGVTLNRPTGQITTSDEALAGGALVSFVVTNSSVSSTDSIVVNVGSGGTANAYRAAVTAVASGSFTITLENITAGSLSEAPVINFAVVNGVVN